MKTKPKKYYMHLMDGKPAAWDEQQQYMYYSSKLITVEEMCKSLRQLKKQQELQKQMNTEQWNHLTRYDYIIVRV